RNWRCQPSRQYEAEEASHARTEMLRSAVSQGSKDVSDDRFHPEPAPLASYSTAVLPESKESEARFCHMPCIAMLYSLPNHLAFLVKKMSIEPTRREFLKLSTIGLAGSVSPGLSSAITFASPPEASGQIEVWTTNKKLRCQKNGTLAWKPATGSSDGAV